MKVSPQAELKQWKCDHCSSAFGRLDHLRRHVLTHTTDRSHVCQFCGALFTRGDVLRRHFKSCKTRIEIGEEVPEGQRGGKHKRACDSCANIRKACDGEIPCSECNHRGRPCTYQRLDEYDEGSAVAANKAQLEAEAEATQESQTSDLDSTQAQTPVSNWDLGPQNFYPDREASRIVYSRNKYGT